jgi:hypothetical protein
VEVEAEDGHGEPLCVRRLDRMAKWPDCCAPSPACREVADDSKCGGGERERKVPSPLLVPRFTPGSTAE